MAGAGAGTAALVAGCGSKPLRLKIRSGSKVGRADVDVLNHLLDLEHYAAAAYTAGIPLLQRPMLKAAQQFLGQELAHAEALSELVRQAGGHPVKPRSRYELGQPRGPGEVVALLQRVELAQLAAYVRTLPELSFGKVRSAVAAIFANDAQHLAVLGSPTGTAPVSLALVGS